jgi:hypothetical protein
VYNNSRTTDTLYLSVQSIALFGDDLKKKGRKRKKKEEKNTHTNRNGGKYSHY